MKTIETIAGIIGIIALASLVQLVPSCAHHIHQQIAEGASSPVSTQTQCPKEPSVAPFLCDRVTPTMECAICTDGLKDCHTARNIYCASSCDAPECQPRNTRPKP
jgi:hypothetical protein